MKVIICGAGKVGSAIANYLEKYDHEITIIDQSSEVVRMMSERHDIRALAGFAAHPEVLERAGAEDADMLIAVTQSDEVNMVICEIAHGLFSVPKKIARIRNQAYLDPRWRKVFSETNISIDVTITPEMEVAQVISRSLKIPGATAVISFVDSKVKIIGVKCTPSTPIINTPLTHLSTLAPGLNIVVVAIIRGSQQIIPLSSDQLQAGDEVYFVVAQEDVAQAMQAFGHTEPTGRRILLLGGGSIGLCLAQQIEEQLPEISLTIIERSKQRAEDIRKHLKKAVILWGDALDREILEEANAENAEIVIAVTEDDKVNILASLLAKHNGAHRAMALINNRSDEALVLSLGIDAVINPRTITVSSILRHVRQGYIRAGYTIHEGFGEIIEAEIHEGSHLIGSTVGDLEIPRQVLVAALVRQNEVIAPRSNMSFQLDDRVVLMVHNQAIKEIEMKFSSLGEYF